MEDKKIIRLFFERDQNAVKETEACYGRRLFGIAMKILKNKEDAEECVNDTYLKTWNAIPPAEPEFFFAYLAQICRFTAFGMLDRQNAEKRRAEIVELTAEMELCIPNKAEELRLSGEETGRLLTEFLKSLTEENRLIFMRRYWFTDSISEISKRYVISESKVKICLFRTRKKLRAYLEREGADL